MSVHGRKMNMWTKELDENWTLTVLGDDPFGINGKSVPAKVPSTVYSTLLEAGLMPDPFYRENELDALKLMENDFVYETAFSLTDKERGSEKLCIRFEGIDTLADIYLDGEHLADTDNMFRTWEFDITDLV